MTKKTTKLTVGDKEDCKANNRETPGKTARPVYVRRKTARPV